MSQAQAWQPDSLREAADAWDAAAADTHREFDVVVRGVQETHDFWSGNAADAARDRAAHVAGEAGQLARALVSAAVAARDGAEQIGAARGDALSSVGAARSLGFLVADDGSVTPPAVAPPAVLGTAGGDVELAQSVLRSGADEFTREITGKLDALAAADADAGHDIDAAFDGVVTPTPTGPTHIDPALVAKWPSMSQGDIAAQIAKMTPDERRQLVNLCPQQVGNTDGVPWDMRIAANRINIAQAILDNRGDARRTEFYRSLLGEVADPTGKGGRVRRQVLAFDPQRSSFIELIGDLGTAKNIGVLVPGMNTTIEASSANTTTATRFVKESRGDLAMITYLGGPFPQGGIPDGIDDAMDTHYALDMAPRLVSFSEDVDRVADGLGRGVDVTYIGHSYGGSILGTAEAMGLTADRTLYLEAAGAGVDVDDVGDWHNRNPHVMRFSMTAPGDWIEPLQGFPLNPHGADPDDMAGVIRLATGDYDDGGRVGGFHSHGDVINRPSDAWRNIYAVMTGRPFTVDINPLLYAIPPWLRPAG